MSNRRLEAEWDFGAGVGTGVGVGEGGVDMVTGEDVDYFRFSLELNECVSIIAYGRGP